MKTTGMWRALRNFNQTTGDFEGLVVTNEVADYQAIGSFASIASGSGVELERTTYTAAMRIYADDGGDDLFGSGSVPDIRGTLSRVLITHDQTGGNTRIFGLQGQLKAAECAWNDEMHAGVYGLFEWTKTAGTALTLGGTGITAAVMGMISTSESGDNALVVNTNHVLAGVASISKLGGVGTLTQTGSTAAFYAGIYSTAWDAAVSPDAWGYGLLIASSVATTGIGIGTCTTGITIGATTTGVAITGTATDGIKISGICADGIEISGAATTTGLNVSGNCVTGITIAAQTTAGIAIGATATGLVISGACSTAGITISGDTPNAINIASTCTPTGASLLLAGAGAYGIDVTGVQTTAAIRASSQTKPVFIGSTTITLSAADVNAVDITAISGGNVAYTLAGVNVLAYSSAAVASASLVGIKSEVRTPYNIKGIRGVTGYLNCSAASVTLTDDSSALFGDVNVDNATTMTTTRLAAVHAKVRGDSALTGLLDVAFLDAEMDVDTGLYMNVDTAKTATVGISVSGAGTYTTGITMNATAMGTGINIGATTTVGVTIGATATGIAITGACSADGIKISGICADGIEISGAATTTGLNVSGNCVTGITIGTQTTAGIAIGAAATGISMAGAMTTGINLTGTTTTGIKMTGPNVTQGIVIGTASYAASGTAIPVDGVTKHSGIEIYFDDGGVKLAAGYTEAMMTGYLVSTAITTADVSIYTVHDYIYLAANVSTAGGVGASWASLLAKTGSVLTTTSGVCDFSAFNASCDVPSGAEIGTGTFVAGISMGGNLGGTHTGKAVAFRVRTPSAGAWDGVFDMPTAMKSDTVGAGDLVYIPIYIGGVAAKLVANYVAA
ncbi:MAG TPA: hypothetical protein VM243_20090 [Phycisphaerae bacterium]|nr:hypothetical protein [Phycisphaerae bacterium]